MDFTWRDTTWGLMAVRRPAGTHLSQSSTSRGKNPLVRDDDNALVTHPVLYAGTAAALGLVSVSFVAGAAAAPHIMSGLSSLRSKLSRRTEETTDVEAPVPLTVVAEVEPDQPDAPRLRAI